MYPEDPAYIHIHMYSCTMLQLYGGTRPFASLYLRHTRILSSGSIGTPVSVPYPLISDKIQECIHYVFKC
jgi:hypothetical protein